MQSRRCAVILCFLFLFTQSLFTFLSFLPSARSHCEPFTQSLRALHAVIANPSRSHCEPFTQSLFTFLSFLPSSRSHCEPFTQSLRALRAVTALHIAPPGTALCSGLLLSAFCFSSRWRCSAHYSSCPRHLSELPALFAQALLCALILLPSAHVLLHAESSALLPPPVHCAVGFVQSLLRVVMLVRTHYRFCETLSFWLGAFPPLSAH